MMRSSTSSEGPQLQLVSRIACSAMCTNNGIHERTAQSAAHFERPAQQTTKPRAKRETRSVQSLSL